MMEHVPFVHLHVHSDYSLLDGACEIGRLLKRAKELRLPALAITDHGNLFGAIRFYQEARQKMGIKPILGEETYLTSGSMKEKKHAETLYHLILLVKDEKGYENLCRLSTMAYLEGFYYKPRVDKEALKSHSQGLIALCGCQKGEVASLLMAEEYEKAKEACFFYLKTFGEGNFYLEIQDHGLPEQKRLNSALIELAKDLSIPYAATNDCHYIHQKDSLAHDVLLCIQTNTSFHEKERLKFPNDQFYLKSYEEMLERFGDTPEALETTLEIASKCNLELELGKPLLPAFPLEEGKNPGEQLRDLCYAGMKKRYGKPSQEVKERLENELAIIEQMGFCSYFLIVHDFCSFAKRKGIPKGPGRGSAAGSLVAYLLEITDLDPIKYGLLFERFLNPQRQSLPDIDIDFCYSRRGEVIDYVTNKYGRDKVSQIITFGTIQARGSIRDVGRVMGLPYAKVDKIAKLVPYELHITLKEAIEKEPELKRLMTEDEEVTEVLTIAQDLEGLVRHASTHAAGLVISPHPLVEALPLYRSSEGDITTQYDMNCLEDIGLLKMDFLGLRTLTVLHDCLENIKSQNKEETDLLALPLDDPSTYELLQRADTKGVFQLESQGMRELAKKIFPNTFEDLIALLALFRPGPMHMLDEYVKRKHGLTPIEFDHPLLEECLKETYGVMLYQEQVMKCASLIGGLSLIDADSLRKAMGKKIPEEMDKRRHSFLQGAKAKGINSETAERIFDRMALFAGYGFNKSHSAAYALIAYQSAYLKAHYPVEFMAALLTSELGDSDKIATYLDECKQMGIKILSPSINHSLFHFTVEGSGIRFGLGAVKNLGESAFKAILRERQEGGSFTSLVNFCHRVDLRHVNRRAIESLIKCGAMDNLDGTRAQLISSLEGAMEFAQSLKKEQSQGQTLLFDQNPQEGLSSFHYSEVEWPEGKLLSLEKEAVGFYLSGHPLALHAPIIKTFSSSSTQQLASLKEGQSLALGGIISKVKPHLSKKGEKMAFCTLEDLEGSCEVIVFPDLLEQCQHLIKEDSSIMLKGRLSEKDGQSKVIAQEVFPLSEASFRLARSVHIRLMPSALEEDTLKGLNNLLLSYPGSLPLFIHCPISPKRQEAPGETLIEVDKPFRLKASEELVQKVEGMLGQGSIWLS